MFKRHCDLDLVVSQVKNQFVAKNNKLGDYRNVVWDVIEFFDDFSIRVVPCEENTLDDELSVIESTFEVSKILYIERKQAVP